MESGAKTTSDSRILGDGRYISLSTYRRSGVAVATTVWFVERDGKIYFRTEGETGKAKRLRNNRNVEFAPSTVRGKVTGAPARGIARLLSPHESVGPAEWIRERYGWRVRVLDFVMRLQGKRPIYFEITPARQTAAAG